MFGKQTIFAWEGILKLYDPKGVESFFAATRPQSSGERNSGSRKNSRFKRRTRARPVRPLSVLHH